MLIQAIQRIILQGISGQKLRLYTVLKKSKETVSKFYKGIAKIFV